MRRRACSRAGVDRIERVALLAQEPLQGGDRLGRAALLLLHAGQPEEAPWRGPRPLRPRPGRRPSRRRASSARRSRFSTRAVRVLAEQGVETDARLRRAPAASAPTRARVRWRRDPPACGPPPRRRPTPTATCGTRPARHRCFRLGVARAAPRPRKRRQEGPPRAIDGAAHAVDLARLQEHGRVVGRRLAAPGDVALDLVPRVEGLHRAPRAHEEHAVEREQVARIDVARPRVAALEAALRASTEKRTSPFGSSAPARDPRPRHRVRRPRSARRTRPGGGPSTRAARPRGRRRRRRRPSGSRRPADRRPPRRGTAPACRCAGSRGRARATAGGRPRARRRAGACRRSGRGARRRRGP